MVVEIFTTGLVNETPRIRYYQMAFMYQQGNPHSQIRIDGILIDSHSEMNVDKDEHKAWDEIVPLFELKPGRTNASLGKV
jgi:hypothetical protein